MAGCKSWGIQSLYEPLSGGQMEFVESILQYREVLKIVETDILRQG